MSILSVSCYEGLIFGLLTVGVYLTFRVLAFPDLSVDATFPLGGATAAVLIVKGVNPFLATFAAFVAGLIAGTVTGLLNTVLRISALLSGILMMVGVYSVNLRIMGGANVPLLRQVTAFDLAGRLFSLHGMSLSIVFAAIVALIFFGILNWFLRTEIGLALRATGDNEEMVRSLGSNTDKNILIGCALSNGLVALTGSLVAQNQGFCDVGMGIGMIVMALAAVILGEALIYPRGITWTLIACFSGTFLYRLFITIALRLGMRPGDLKMITSLLVVVALGIPYLKKKLYHEWVPPASRM
ncbi:MAG: ABC transporter permease [Deltaproteobacteria bacterium]|nr:ABC transporter permease [Deltaproteobacteria bacterium]MBW2300808.1 ABC transporter permease [Deltaproteobacteria bacterium]